MLGQCVLQSSRALHLTRQEEGDLLEVADGQLGDPLLLGGFVEEHRSLGGSIISRLDNGAFVGLIYSLLVFS